MMKVLAKLSEPACRLSWLLVEVHEGPKVEYYAIHSVEVLGDCNDAYVSKKVCFTLERHECEGIIRLASDDLKIIKNERDRLLSEQEKIFKTEPHLKPELWCLVRQTTDDSKIRLTTVNCKKLTCIESPDRSKKHFLMEKDQEQVPTILLHIIDSEQQLFDEMAFLNKTFMQSYLSEEKDREVELEGLEEAFFLVQYFEDISNLIYTIVRYRDTIWKDRNLFPNVVAYITDGKVVSQCVIIRKSYDVTELTAILSQIKKSCDNLDYSLLHSQLKNVIMATETEHEVFQGS